MIYFILLLSFLLVFYGISQFFHFPSIKESIFHFVLQQITILTFSITLFAIFITSGKTIFLLFVPFYLYLFKKKHLIFRIPEKESIKKSIPYTVLIIPIIVFQFFLTINISTFTPYLPSNDVLLYAGFANGLTQFGQENKFEALNAVYPSLFSGVSPYHYFELWLTSLLHFFTQKSCVYLLQLVVYPYLVWIFVLGIASVFEYYISQLTRKHFIMAFVLLFVGPVYISIYETLFHDGDFFPTTVFTIAGFVKQTLSFSYYGQKHLPVYIFGIVSFLFILKQRHTLAILIGGFIAILSFGTFPGVIGGFGLLFLLQKKLRTKQNFLVLLAMSIGILCVLVLFKMGVNQEVSQKTFYHWDISTFLLIKTEIVRVASKFFGPLIWFSILYFPFIIFFGVYRKQLFQQAEIKLLILFTGFAFIAGSLSISLVQGMNSDQFITNLLPLFNTVIVICIIYLYTQIKAKIVLQSSVAFLVVINVFFLLRFYQKENKDIDSYFSINTQLAVSNLLEKEDKNPLIAYLLSDDIVKKFPPLIWYPHKPGKPMFIDNYTNLVNINYPYFDYGTGSAAIAYSPDNQMRYYLKGKVVPEENFEKHQEKFLKKFGVRWLFCAKGVTIPPALEKMIAEKYFDTVSGEVYCKLKI